MSNFNDEENFEELKKEDASKKKDEFINPMMGMGMMNPMMGMIGTSIISSMFPDNPSTDIIISTLNTFNATIESIRNKVDNTTQKEALTALYNVVLGSIAAIAIGGKE